MLTKEEWLLIKEALINFRADLTGLTLEDEEKIHPDKLRKRKDVDSLLHKIVKEF
jgi:hypothetical protein